MLPADEDGRARPGRRADHQTTRSRRGGVAVIRGLPTNAGFAAADTTRAYRRDIDGLRGVAVLAVVLVHAGVPFMPGGYVGVDVFFVISGFLIAGIIKGELEEGHFSLARFYERRARRILPALVVMIAVALVAGWLILLPSAFQRFAATAVATLFSVSNFWFWRDANNYFDPGNDAPLLHTWSLGVEEQFYLLFPLLLLVLFRWRRSLVPVVIVTAVVALFVVGAGVAWLRPAAGFYLTPFRVWELGIGVVFALTPLPLLRARWLREGVAAVGFAAILGAAVVYTNVTPFPGLSALLPTLGAAALIHAGTSGDSAVGRVLSLGPIVFVGLISYSLYLWHWPILIFLQRFLGVRELTTTETVLAVAASFVVATLSWRFVERPFRRRTWLSRRQVLWSSLGAVGLTSIAAVLVLAGRGVPDRFAPELQPLVALLDADQVGRFVCSEAEVTDGYCKFGVDGGTPTVLLWGDSHASAIEPAIDGAARLAGVSGLWIWSPSCPPMIGLLRTNRPDCEGFNPRVLEELRSHPAIHTIILGARWALWDHDWTEAGLTPMRLNVDDPALPGEPGPDGVVAFGLDQLLDVLLAEGYDVILLGTTPEFTFSVPDGMLAELRWGIPHTVTNRGDYLARNDRMLRLFQEFDERPGVAYVPIYDVLCPDECPIMIDDHPVYKDGDHLSAYGATALLTDVLAERIWGVTAR